MFSAPGARGFFGEGYPFHRIWKYLGMDWRGATFVAKTTTLGAREGNMPLTEDGLTPRELIPRCIVVEPRSGHVLNAVGLSGPGAAALLIDGRWQERDRPFMLSFMSVAGSRDERLDELRRFVALLGEYRPYFRAPFALQINFSCPNVGVHHEGLAEEIEQSLEIASRLGVPLVPNFNVLVQPALLARVAAHPACDALWVANTIPWGDPRIDWPRIWGSTESPLQSRGFEQAGGLSGPACLPFLLDRIVEARRLGVTKPIVAGNGIQSIDDVRCCFVAGASAIALGVAGIVRSWRMSGLIAAAHFHARRCVNE